MSDLSRAAKELVAAARDQGEPTAFDRERVRAALTAKIALGAGGSAATSGSANAGFAAKLALPLAIASAVGLGVGAYLILSTRSAPPVQPQPEPTPQPTPQPEPQPTPTPQPTPEPESTPTPYVSERPSSRTAKPAPIIPQAEPAAPASLAAELRLLGAARAALRNGDGQNALDLLTEHASKHPAGILAEEAAALRVEALCRVGRRAEAAALATRFATTWPRSPLGPRVKDICNEGGN